jgi:hypothetical protein
LRRLPLWLIRAALADSRLDLRNRRAAAALAAPLNLLPAIGTPPSRAHPKEPMWLPGQLADHGDDSDRQAGLPRCSSDESAGLLTTPTGRM